MTRKLFMIVFAWLAVLCTVHSQEMNDEQVKQHINKTAAALKSMQCDFVQTKHIKLLNEDMVSKGKMYYQQSNRLRWEYVSPYTYTFILNGSKVLLKNNKRNDVIDVNQNKMFKEIARIMMNSVVGTCLSDEKDFKASMSQNATEWIATLQPMRKDMRQMMQYIVLHFSKEKAMVSKVELIEKKGDKTVIELKNIRTNAAIPANTFSVN